jgi:hypothetical protein
MITMFYVHYKLFVIHYFFVASGLPCLTSASLSCTYFWRVQGSTSRASTRDQGEKAS